jgi:hypothetical protein
MAKGSQKTERAKSDFRLWANGSCFGGIISNGGMSTTVMTSVERMPKSNSAAALLNKIQDFRSNLSRLLTDDTLTVLELWTGIQDYWNDVTIRLLEIRKLKNNRGISCTLRLTEPADTHLHGEWTTAALELIGWTVPRGGRIFYYRTWLRSPDQFDAFCQFMSVTALEALPSLWGQGQQYYRFR